MLLPALLLLAATTPALQFEARIQDGMSALDKNDFPRAISSFEQAAKIAPKNPSVWMLIAQTYGKQKNVAAALSAARKAEQFGVDDPKVLQALAEFYARVVPDRTKAASLGARYAERSPNDATAWRRLALFCRNNGLPDQAIAAASKDLQQHPYDEQAHFGLAQSYLVKQDFASAVRVLQDARGTFDKSPQIELALGVAYYGLRKFPEAVDQFVRTMKLAPEVPQPYSFLDRILDHATGRLTEIAQLAAAYETSHPESPLGYKLHAKALLAQSPGEAGANVVSLLRKVIALKDTDADAHYQLGLLLERQKDLAGAATQLERCVELDAQYSAARVRLARVYDRLGRKEDALKQRELAEKLSQENAKPK